MVVFPPPACRLSQEGVRLEILELAMGAGRMVPSKDLINVASLLSSNRLNGEVQQWLGDISPQRAVQRAVRDSTIPS